MDEAPSNSSTRSATPLPASPGQTDAVRYEYVRNGMGNLFLACEPLTGWRHVAVTERRARRIWAHVIRYLVRRAFPRRRARWCWSWTNLTPTRPSLYEAFPPAEAKRMAAKLEIHHTPKHG